MYRGTYAYNRHNDLRLYKLDDAHLSCVAATGASLYNAGVTAVSVLVLGRDLIFLVLLKLIRFDVAFQFSVEPEAILISAGLFGAIFLVILIWNIFQVQRVNPVELLQGGKKGDNLQPQL